MLKHYYKKFHQNSYIVKFGNLVNAKHLWDFTPQSIAKAIAIGLGCSWIPLPFHTIIAVTIAILIDCNIPLVAIAIWFANPITMPFMYYAAYLLGDFLLNIHTLKIKFHLSIDDVLTIIDTIWEPFILGCLIFGFIFAIVSYLLVSAIFKLIPNALDK